MNTPVLRKISKRRSQRDNRLIGAVVVLKIPSALQSPETTVAWLDWPGLQQLATGIGFAGVGQGSNENLAGVDMLGMARQQIPELREPGIAFWIIGVRLSTHPPEECHAGINIGWVGIDPPPQCTTCHVVG
jgi:hypothetical protein